MSKLSDQDKKLWNFVTKNVTKLGDPLPSKKIFVPIRSTLFHTILDLHGLTVQQAYEKTNQYLSEAKNQEIKKVIIITGKSGLIKLEFKTWLENIPSISKFQIMNDGGAWEIWQ